MELIPLNIPAGWCVIKNSFFDVESEPNANAPWPKAAFVQDILSLQSGFPWESDSDHSYVLDLGWYPDQDPDGRYRLVLLQRDWDDILCTFESRDRWIIRAQLERWLDLVNRAVDRNQLERWLGEQSTV